MNIPAEGPLGPMQNVPKVLFRTVYDRDEDAASARSLGAVSALGEMGILLPFSERTTPTTKDVDLHLRWRKYYYGKPWRSPFVSFTSDWSKAQRFRKLYARQGKKNVRIIAIQTKGLTNVYNASKYAKHLKYYWRRSWKDGNPINHRREYLILDGVPTGSDAILGVFHDDRPFSCDEVSREVLTCTGEFRYPMLLPLFTAMELDQTEVEEWSKLLDVGELLMLLDRCFRGRHLECTERSEAAQGSESAVDELTSKLSRLGIQSVRPLAVASAL